MSDFFDAFRDGRAARPQLTDGPRRPLTPTVAPEYERNWLERIFAPLEAPQQALFSYTLAQEDGFQLRDVFEALNHGARYFNPWSNRAPILASQLRESGGWEIDNPYGAFSADLAISLLYDPLLISGALKALGLVRHGSRAARTIGAITNPAEAAIGAGIMGARGASRAAARTLEATIGKERTTKFTTQLQQWLTNPNANVHPEAIEAKRRLEVANNRWRQRNRDVLRQARELGGGNELAKLMGEVLELESAFLYANRAALTSEQAADITRIQRRVQKLGVDEELFWNSYSDLRNLDSDIGYEALRVGLMDGETFEKMRTTHARRMFAAWERPGEYLERIDAAIAKNPKLALDREGFARGALTDELTRFRKTLDDWVQGRFTSSQHADMFDEAVKRGRFERSIQDSPYFTAPDATHATWRFNPKRFSDDLHDFAGSEVGSSLTFQQLFRHVQDDMLGGVEMPPAFWEALGNHLQGAWHTSPGLGRFRDTLAQMVHGPNLAFRQFRDRAQVLAERENLSDEIREILGEIESGFTRVTGQVTDAAKAVETRRFQDSLAGVVRVDDSESLELVREVTRALEKGDDALADTITATLRDRLGLEELAASDVAGKGMGDVLAQLDNNVTSAFKDEAKGHVMQLLGDNLGPLQGRYTDPGTFGMLSAMQRIERAANPTGQLMDTITGGLRKLTGNFKLAKVILDPVAQFRNFVGNAIIMDVMGMNPLRMDNMTLAIKELHTFAKTGELGEYMSLAEKAGLSIFQHSYARHELMGMANRLDNLNWGRESAKTAYGRVVEVFANAAKNAVDAGTKMFEFNENLFKMMSFIETTKKLKEGVRRAGGKLDAETLMRIGKQAGARAEKALFDYSTVPYAVDFIRQYGIVPFATFPFKVTGAMAEALYERPWRVLKYDRIAETINQHVSGGPEHAAKVINGLPSYLRDAMVVNTGIKDRDGRPLFVDLSYFAPWYALTDMIPDGADGDVRRMDGGFRGGVLSPPFRQLYEGVFNNRDGMGQPIWRATDSNSEKFKKLGAYLTSWMLPGSTPFVGTRSHSVGRALEAYATTSPTPVDWGILADAQALRATDFDRPALNSQRYVPQTQAQMGVAPDNPLASALLGVVGLATGGMVASDSAQVAHRTRAGARANKTEIAREIARVKRSDLPHARKLAEIQELKRQLRESNEQARSLLSGL